MEAEPLVYYTPPLDQVGLGVEGVEVEVEVPPGVHDTPHYK